MKSEILGQIEYNPSIYLKSNIFHVVMSFRHSYTIQKQSPITWRDNDFKR